MVIAPAAVMAFSELMAMDSCHHKWTLALYDTGRYMRLDAAAQRALNVMKQRTDANDTFSLYGLMNRGPHPHGQAAAEGTSSAMIDPAPLTYGCWVSRRQASTQCEAFVFEVLLILCCRLRHITRHLYMQYSNMRNNLS